MFDWSLLFSASFWFSFGWNPLQPTTALVMVVFFGIFTAAGIALWIVPAKRAQVDKPLCRALSRGGNVLVTTGILGILFTFFSYEQVPFLSARLWFLLIALLFLGWGGWIVWRAHILVPAEREAARVKEKFEKYL